MVKTDIAAHVGRPEIVIDRADDGTDLGANTPASAHAWAAITRRDAECTGRLHTGGRTKCDTR
jgi:hypothetical protein